MVGILLLFKLMLGDEQSYFGFQTGNRRMRNASIFPVVTEIWKQVDLGFLNHNHPAFEQPFSRFPGVYMKQVH